MAVGDHFGDDGRTINQNPNASGTGGVVGPISAAVGDVGLGNSQSALGDTTFNTKRNFNFAGPVVNHSNNNQLLIIGALMVAGFIAAKKMRVL